MEVGSDYDSQNTIVDFLSRSSSNSSLQEEYTQSNTLPRRHTNTSSVNSSQQDEQHRVIKCYCGLESVLGEVKVNTGNKERFFWSCSKFGGPNHLRRCNFFRWESELIQNDDENDVMVESSSMAQNRINNPNVLIESVNNHNNINDNSEADLSPYPDQLSENEVVIPTRSGAMMITTPPTTSYQRNRNQASSPQAFRSSLTRSQSPPSSNITNNMHTTARSSTVPKYSTPQLLDIVRNHLVQRDKKYQNWVIANQAAKKDLEESMKEIEKLKVELEMSNRENESNEREIIVLKAKKRILEFENDKLKKENHELKRRRH